MRQRMWVVWRVAAEPLLAALEGRPPRPLYAISCSECGERLLAGTEKAPACLSCGVRF